MPLWRFETIPRYIRTFNHTLLDLGNEEDLLKVFQAAEPWSDLIQKVSAQLYIPGNNVTVDECMGTARPNCGITKELKLVKGKDKAGASGFKYNKVAQIAWKDNSLVLFLSTVYSGADDQRTLKRRKKPADKGAQSKPIQETFGDVAIKVIPIPTVSTPYNDE
ncbi:hypothetical protein BFJ70_g17526 [Fusarium oxysporum]|nr:hypothetical protein FocnCong_v010316 [Fusarium oxysporum f. sp. conglutinans]RKK12084.1 hypothetical protein BFJ65_g13960 [Fusarium oxysporum f. sp. cepae]RKK23905.1 hypothetical protein BFJ67_g16909 [Fusarium oxysporum f. sp. cepae]RKK27071.1 hypothetical protein BFJ66_g16819 [Fusarium oxysporum f. sp. cepae]RKK99152.1 hypothetical protein BFJ70_g17526 [Fusarium oxysporum]